MQTPMFVTAQCQVPTVKYNGREYNIQTDKNGFRYIKVSIQGKRTVIPVKAEAIDVVFDYVFNGTYRTHPNPLLDMCVILRTKGATERIYNQHRVKLNITDTFQEFKQKVSNLNKNFKNEKNIHSR